MLRINDVATIVANETFLAPPVRYCKSAENFSATFVGRDGTAYAQTLLSLRDIGLAAARSLVGSKGPPDLYSLPLVRFATPMRGITLGKGGTALQRYHIFYTENSRLSPSHFPRDVGDAIPYNRPINCFGIRVGAVIGRPNRLVFLITAIFL